MIVGATGVGKTRIVTDVIAKRFPDIFELVSADSRQVYRYLDIGTAKPGSRERAAIPHHLIDIVDPREQYDLGRFVRDADNCFTKIRARQRVPILAGGTGFYVRGVLHGLPQTPEPSEETRAELRQELERHGGLYLHEELKRVDPVSAQAIAPTDNYRILRALEVYRSTGRPRSSFLTTGQTRRYGDTLVIKLERDRVELYARIDARVRMMMGAGLPDEIKRLLEMGYGPGDPGLQTIGYREFLENGERPPYTDETRAAIEKLIARNTRRYAKRQGTYFRGLSDLVSVPADDNKTIYRLVAEFLDRSDTPG